MRLSPLCRQQAMNVFGINVLRHTRDPKAKRRGLLLAGAWVFVGLVILGYLTAMCWGLVILGAAEAVMPYLITIVSLVLLFFGTFSTGSVLYSRDGYEMLCALPVTPGEIVISRLGRMYLENALLTLAAFLPGVAVLGILTERSLGFYPAAMIAVLAVPLVPMSVSALAGAAVQWISSRMKYKALTEAVLTILLVVGIFSVMPGAATLEEELTPELLLSMSKTILELLENLYPLGVWLGKAVFAGNLLGSILYLGAGIAGMGVVCFGVSRLFHPICRSLFSVRGKAGYRMESASLRERGILPALVVRELRRYFASGVYLTNTIVGPVLSVVLAGSLLAADLEQMAGMLPVALDLPGIVPFMVGMVLSMMPASSVSVSMEGSRFWILKSLPVSPRDILRSKVLMNLLVMLPFYGAGQILMTLALKPGAAALLWQLVIPGLMAVFCCVFGVFVNLRLPVLDWTEEVTVVKQSASALVGGLGGPLVCAACTLVCAVMPGAFAHWARLGICLVLGSLSLGMLRLCEKTRLEEL